MTFDELGAALRAERERRGLRIEDAADHLKISARHLRALEEGDGDSLPHPAYARGFIRSYAAYLGISSEEIHDALTAMTPGDAVPQPPAFAPETAPSERRSGRGGVLFVLVLALLAGTGYAVWHWGVPAFSGLEERRLAQPSPPLTSARPAPPSGAEIAAKSAARQEIQGAPAAGPGASPERRDAPAEAAGQSAAQADPLRAQAGQPAGAPASASRQERADAPSPSAAQPDAVGAGDAADRGAAEAAPAAAAGDGAAVPGQHKVIITATEECWIHSNADKTDTRQFSLRKGDTFALTFARSLELKLGNAGGVRLRYDGQSLPPPGQSGQVKTLTFPPQSGQ